jgi:hypothetical protein
MKNWRHVRAAGIRVGEKQTCGQGETPTGKHLLTGKLLQSRGYDELPHRTLHQSLNITARWVSRNPHRGHPTRWISIQPCGYDEPPLRTLNLIVNITNRRVDHDHHQRHLNSDWKGYINCCPFSASVELTQLFAQTRQLQNWVYCYSQQLRWLHELNIGIRTGRAIYTAAPSLLL